MKIIGFMAENFKRLRLVEITPNGHLVTITGKNGQGKTSVIDAWWFALGGKRAMPEKPVRKGAEKMTVKLNLGTFTVTRTVTPGGVPSLKLEMAKDERAWGTPQEMLDSILGELTFDPLEFVSMKPKEQIDTLRRVAKIDLDVDAINQANAEDYTTRTGINRDALRLQGEIASITVQDGLPKAKADEQSLLEQLAAAGKTNQDARLADAFKDGCGRELEMRKQFHKAGEDAIEKQKEKIDILEETLKAARLELDRLSFNLDDLGNDLEAAQIAYDAAPAGIYADVSKLTEDLQTAQLINREIDKRSRRDDLASELRIKQSAALDLTRRMEDREEQKREAIASAQMPVAGLAFTENEVLFNGIPLKQLGEAEQIRISASIAMAANPKLRVLAIRHGEALDADSLAVLTKMAEDNDFQIWMARVDSSGKMGIYLEDGMVKSVNNG